MKHTALLIFIILFLSSCVRTPSTDESKGKYYQIDLKTAKEENFESIFERISFIPLETIKDHEIGQIHKILPIGDKYVLLDSQTNSIFLYKNNGKYESQIQAIGNGPGEYVQITDFCINEQTQEIKVLDGIQNKLLTFDLRGNFIHETKLTVYPSPLHLSHLSDSLYAFDFQRCSNTKEWQYQLIVSSESFTGNVQKYLSYDKPLGLSFSPRTTLFSLHGETIYVPLYSSTIYTVSSSQIIPRYTFLFGDHWVDQQFIDTQWNDALDFMNRLEDMKYIYYFNILENESHIYSDFMYKGKRYHLVVNKENDHIYFQKETDKYKCKYTGNIIGSIDEQFIIALSPDEYNEKIDNTAHTYKNVHLLSEDQNPVLMLFSFSRI